MYKCKGIITHKIFTKGDFNIFKIKINKMLEGEGVKTQNDGGVILKGNVPTIKSGVEFIFGFDKEEYNEKYGYSYNITYLSKEFNASDNQELLEYYKTLTSDRLAERLIGYAKSYEWISTRNIDELSKISGIGERTAIGICDKHSALGDISEAISKLKPYGLTMTEIQNICKAFNGAVKAVQVVLETPYELIKKVNGIGFKKADAIALKIGVGKYSLERMKQIVLFILETKANEGKSYLNGAELYQEFEKLNLSDTNSLDAGIQALIEENVVVISYDRQNIALKQMVDLEEYMANRFKHIMSAPSLITVPSNYKDIISQTEKEQGWCYSDEQLQGIETALFKNLVVITGLAGTGKTTIVNVLTKILKDYTITMSCLSAKACQRLSEVVDANITVETIHKLLGLNSREPVQNLATDILIIDEGSMISGSLFSKILKVINLGTKIIILGDTGQLTAIGNCAVFSDLVNSNINGVVKLTKVHRQALKSAIITESIAIRNQEPIFPKNFYGHKVLGELKDLELFIEKEQFNLLDLTIDTFMKEYKKVESVLEVQIISPLKKRGQLCCDNINLEIQKKLALSKDKSFNGLNGVKIYIGDKVINTKNKYSGVVYYKNSSSVSIFNGNIGIVTNILCNGNVVIDFQAIGEVVVPASFVKNINLAYAISCHSSQGSQWQNIIFAFDFSAYVLLNVEILYTALTRAISHCSVITTNTAFAFALKNLEQKTKQTLLCNMLK